MSRLRLKAGWLMVTALALVAACTDFGGEAFPRRCGRATPRRAGEAMKLADVLTLVNLVLAPGFDTAAAERRFGPIDRWIGGRAYVKDNDPAFRGSAIETDGTASKAFAGVQTYLRKPLMVPWSDLTEALGKPQRTQSTTGLRAPPTYVFRCQVPGGSGVVSIEYFGAPTKDIVDEKIAGIEGIIIRPDEVRPRVPKSPHP